MNDELEQLLIDVLSVAVSKGKIGKKDVAKITKQVSQRVIESQSKSLLRELHRRAPGMLAEHKILTDAFLLRNGKRWKKAIDLLEMQWVISQEILEEYDLRNRKTAIANEDFKFEALVHLAAKGLLISREAICLIQNGYADGAFTRWRSLHEICVFGSFISQGNNIVAKMYLASFHFAALKSASQFNLYARKNGHKKIPKRQIDKMKSVCDTLKSEFGHDLKDDNSWANGGKRTTIAEIELKTKLDHWRPTYAWASKHVHSNHRPLHHYLGLKEASEGSKLVGASNSGMSEPIEYVSKSLATLVACVLSAEPSLETSIKLRALTGVVEKCGKVSKEVEASTLLKHRTRKSN